MAARGPISLLDRREVDTTTHVVRDRLTRRRSPARESNRYSYSSDYSDLSYDEEDVSLQIPQPYKTSFSAVVPTLRNRRDRSRSTSPGASSLKGRNRHRSKSPGGRRKHVTYDEKVVIRESGTQDSIVTNLSDRDSGSVSGHSSLNSSGITSDMSNSSPRDISSQLRQLSEEIVREYPLSSDKESPVVATRVSNNHAAKNMSTPNGTANHSSQLTEYGSRSPRENGQSYYREGRSRIVIKEDYNHDRSVTYQAAVKQKYSDDVKDKAESLIEDTPTSSTSKRSQSERKQNGSTSPNDEQRGSRERRNSLPLEDDEEIAKNRLTPSKRSISASIGNFFRKKWSPHSGRKNKKSNLSSSSSTSLSPGDDLDGSFDKHSSASNLSRGKLRRSLMKLFKPRSSRRSDSSVEDVNQADSPPEVTQTKKTPNSSLYMKSIEQTGQSDKDMYQKFKERRTPQRSGEATLSSKPQAMKVSPRVMSPGSETAQSNGHVRENGGAYKESVEPPNSLDVRLVPKSIKTIQSSELSCVSRDDSIGECSLDQGSEPSLIVSQGSEDVVSRAENKENEAVTPVKAGDLNSQQPSDLKLNYTPMPLFSNSTEFLPKETVRTPSYLRLSSAVSGYGHYSRYSAYKGIEKRSPYSSTLSLRSSRSDLTTPQSPTEMPIGKILNIQAPTNYPPIKNEVLSPKAELGNTRKEFPVLTNGASSVNTTDTEQVNGDSHKHVNGGVSETVNGSENGHVIQVGNFVATGDPDKDTEFFLNVAQVEEDRLLLLCSKCEGEMVDESLPEEASGKLRSAVGKANLLISQKFNQFRDLCQQHKHPDGQSKETKWEDLQGFWEMVKLQVDDLDETFTEIDLMRQNGWREITSRSRRSSASSSPKSGSQSMSNASTPSHTPGSKRRAARLRDTPESSPESTQKAKMAAKVREEQRKKMLAEKRAAMKQHNLQTNNEDVEIFIADNSSSKEASPSRTSGSDV